MPVDACAHQVDGPSETQLFRSIGILPITVDCSAQELKVEMQLPKEVRPDHLLRADFAVVDAAGLPVQAHITLAAVDQGILSLTNYESPDPHQFLFGRKAFATKISDLYHQLMPEIKRQEIDQISATGGGGGKGRAVANRKQLLNPISAERFRSAIRFLGNIVTDDQGVAHGEFKVPEFNGTMRLMAVVGSADGKTGHADAELLVRQPLMVRPTFPRFLACGDLFEVPVAIFNQSKADGIVQLNVVAVGLQQIGTSVAPVTIKAGGEGAVRLRFQAPDLPGKVTLELKAVMGDEETVVKVEIAVRPIGGLSHRSSIGFMDAGTKKTFAISTDYLAGTEDLHLVLAPEPTLQLADTLKYLLQYPYGCLEQTTSRVFPLLHLSQLGQRIDPERYKPEQIRNIVDAGIRRVLSMQSHDGGFGWWPGATDNYAWGSVYATHMLVEADVAGYEVPKEPLAEALEYLRTSLGDSDTDNCLKVYSCYVLAKAGKPNHSWTMRLHEQRAELPIYSRFQLAVAMNRIGGRTSALELIQATLPDDDVKKMKTDRYLHSQIRQEAIALDVLLDIDPENRRVHDIARRLSRKLQIDRWYTTQNNAFVVMALGRYMKSQTRENEYTVIVTKDGKKIRRMTNKESFVVRNGKNITVAVEGKGRLFYHFETSGVPVLNKPKAFESDLRVQRRFRDLDGQELPMDRLCSGDLVVVELEIAAAQQTSNVVINDLLPAGLEIENPNLASRTSIPWLKKDALSTVNVERRDDRLLVFADLPGSGVYKYRYAARFVTPGTFTQPGVHAFCMYDSSIAARSDMHTLKVQAE
ncbi:hypothetical protein BVY04_05010 [bacterium M21]|nr:hypothetical protein BVY04_05010 [bacterium M21]